MADAMVKATQQWLNHTYGNKHGYEHVKEDGVTGWPTVHALLRALQIELGIAEPSDNFGDGTTAKYKASPITAPSDAKRTSNKYAILQGALWCKGYDPKHYGTLDNHYDTTVADAVKRLETDAGIAGDGRSVSVNLMKALLSMDQFRLIPGTGGDAHIRAFQQKINAGYEAYCGLVPCDGLYDRTTNRAVILMLQALENMPVSVANGNFGPSTRQHCPQLPYGNKQVDYSGHAYAAGRIAQFSQLANFCLYVNGYGDGTFGSAVITANVKQFQQEYALPVTGQVNLSTWLSLCISCGDESRKGDACDTRFEITDAHVATLQANNYRYVGRYLTGGTFKQLRAGELQRLFANGLKPFLIFEETYEKSGFTPLQGVADAKKAVAAAQKFQIPDLAVIFFAVDFDALDGDVTSNVLPYFKAVKDELAGKYRVGVYGPRNVCSRVCGAKYADYSFVSDMSTGFSGNMGYRIPSGWVLDQISNVTLTHGSDSLEIDNDLTHNNPDKVAVTRLTSPTVATLGTWNGTYGAMINRSGENIAVYTDMECTQKSGFYIAPNEMYLRRMPDASSHTSDGKSDLIHFSFEVAVGNGSGGIVSGWYSRDREQNYGDSSHNYPWYAQQVPFTGWNVSGSGVVDSATHQVTIDGHGGCRVFTLRHDARCVWSSPDSGERILPAGSQIAVENLTGTVGATNPNYLWFSYWRSKPGAKWQQITEGGTIGEGPIVTNPFIDMGFQYGGTPEVRLLM